MYVDQNLYHGRPVSGQRLDKELRCYDLLDRLGLTYCLLYTSPSPRD